MQTSGMLSLLPDGTQDRGNVKWETIKRRRSHIRPLEVVTSGCLVSPCRKKFRSLRGRLKKCIDDGKNPSLLTLAKSSKFLLSE